jgi:hypothetical protein
LQDLQKRVLEVEKSIAAGTVDQSNAGNLPGITSCDADCSLSWERYERNTRTKHKNETQEYAHNLLLGPRIPLWACHA